MNISTRTTRNVSAGVVATIAAWSSYSHMTHVALRFGEVAEVAYLLPLSVDGLMICAAVAMADDKRGGRKVRLSARIAFVIGILASIGANIAAAQPTIGGRLIAGWPALGLLLTVELLSRAGKPDKAATVEVEATAPRFTPERQAEINAKRAATRKRNARAKAKRGPVEEAEAIVRAPVSPAVGYVG